MLLCPNPTKGQATSNAYYREYNKKQQGEKKVCQIAFSSTMEQNQNFQGFAIRHNSNHPRHSYIIG